jgi:DNA-nicking Smr family endonuclease
MTVVLEEEVNELHRQARLFGRKSDECSKRSKSAYRRNQHEEAKLQSLEAKKYKEMMKAANLKAANVAFESNNDRLHFGQIDLHDLHVKEALEKLEERVKDIKKANCQNLTVITGQGLHSDKGKAKIKPAVIKFAVKRKIDWEVDQTNSGRINFKFEVPKTRDVPNSRDQFSMEISEPYSLTRFPLQSDSPSFNWSWLKLPIFCLLVILGLSVMGYLLNDLFTAKNRNRKI